MRVVGYPFQFETICVCHLYVTNADNKKGRRSSLFSMSNYNVFLLSKYNVFLLSRRDQHQAVFVFSRQLDQIPQRRGAVIQPP